MDTQRLIRKAEAEAVAKRATATLQAAIDAVRPGVEAAAAAELVGCVARVSRRCGQTTYTVTAQIVGITLGLTGVRLVGEFIDPSTGMTSVTQILIDELHQ